MTDLLQTLIELERRLVLGGGEAYRRQLLPEAVVIVPGGRLDREECAAAIEATPPWDAFELSDASSVALGDAALVSYRFDGRRGDLRYVALMSSLYVLRGDAMLLALHQQTPLP